MATLDHDDFNLFFDKDCADIQHYLEKRHAYYIKSFIKRAISLVVLMLISGVLVCLYHAKLVRTYHMDGGLLVATYIFLMGVGILALLSPFAAYSGVVLGSESYVSRDGKLRCFFKWLMVPRPYKVFLNEKTYPTLKEMLYTEIFAKFGQFSFRPRGMNARLNLMNPLLLPHFDEYRAEDCFSGAYEEAMLNIAEAQPIRLVEDKEKVVFKGLFITMDISELGVKIRGSFRGRSALLPKDNVVVKGDRRFDQFKKLSLQEYESKGYRLYTTEPREAQAILRKSVLNYLIQLDEVFRSLVLPEPSCMQRLVWWSLCFLRVISRGQVNHQLREPVEDSINHRAQLSLYDDCIQITLPCRADLFTPPTLFSEEINRDEVRAIYQMMDVIASITCEIQARKDAFESLVRA